VRAEIAAAATERDRLPLCVLWATGARVSEMLTLRAGDVQRDALVPQASERADVRVLALRSSRYGSAGEPAPVHPHLFRHSRVRKIVRDTRSLPLAQRQAGWSRLQMAYLTLGDDEARQLMRQVTE
jgi:integrase